MARSCLMPSDRLVTLPGGGPLLQIQPLEDGVLAVALLDAQHGLLELPLPSVGGLIRLLPLLPLGIVGEQGQLLRLVPLRRLPPRPAICWR